MELASCQCTGAKNFDVTPRFLVNLWNPVVEYLLSKHLYEATEWRHAEYLSRYLTDGQDSYRILQYEAGVPTARPQYLIHVYLGSIHSVFRADVRCKKCLFLSLEYCDPDILPLVQSMNAV